MIEFLNKFNYQYSFDLHFSTEATTQFENFVFVLGINDGSTITRDVVKINLHRPNEISTHGQISPTIKSEAVAAVYRNTMYVSGLGSNGNEIWKYNVDSGWVRCASLLVHGRLGHCAAFINDVLYICGGLLRTYVSKPAQFSVEAFNAVTDKCNTVGGLVHLVYDSGNCVPFKSSLYIFGGKDRYHKDVSHIQMYNTKQNTCTLLTKPMPIPSAFTQAVLWETSAILVGENNCFIFDFETETLQEREQFKVGIRDFGLVLHDGRAFVIGGINKDADKKWKLRDFVCSVPIQNILKDEAIEWKIHGNLPKPSLVQAYGEMRMTV